MATLVLLLLQAVDGEPLVKSVREKIAASTIRVAFERAEQRMSGTLRIKGQDRFALEIRRGAAGATTRTVLWTDAQGEPVLEWPTDQELKDEWKRFD